MNFSSLPKVELHLHLDCTLSFRTLRKLKPGATLEDYEANYRIPAKCASLKEYIEKADRGLHLMQTPQNIQAVVDDLFYQLKEDNVLYAELRYAPHLHLDKGLTPRQVVEVVNDAMQEGIRRYGVEVRVILCTLRHYDAERSMEVAGLVKDFKGSLVTGMDIAGPEQGFDIQNHVAAFSQVREAGICCTAHAGESRGPESVWETLKELKPLRVGHGVRSADDKDLMKHLSQEDIHLEVCPTSNVQTNVYPTLEDHRIMDLLAHDVSLSINTDARSISGSTLASEYAKLNKLFGWKKEDFLRANLEAVRHAFVDDETKARLRDKLVAAYK
jgi:adenosine deaminase